jgi:hypothetical protein
MDLDVLNRVQHCSSCESADSKGLEPLQSKGTGGMNGGILKIESIID